MAFVVPLLLGGRGPAGAPDRATLLTVAREIMASARYCALVTIADDGEPQARAVDPFPPEEELTVWIATNAGTRKVGQIRKDPRVTLFYFDAKSSAYVTIVGEARLVDDAAEKAKRWKDDWASFYKEKNRGPDYLLIRIRPKRLELMSPTHGLPSDPMAWRPAVVEFH